MAGIWNASGARPKLPRLPAFSVDISPYTEETFWKLGQKKNWNKAAKLLFPISERLFATTCESKEIMDDFRRLMDTSTSRQGNNILHTLLSNPLGVVFDWKDPPSPKDASGDEKSDTEGSSVTPGGSDNRGLEFLYILLSLGIDVDTVGEGNARPIHYCAAYDKLDYWNAIKKCRPNKDYLLTDHSWLGPIRFLRTNAKFPLQNYGEPLLSRRTALSELEVFNFGPESPWLAHMAYQREWFAVKNVVRRGLVDYQDFQATYMGKTAEQRAMGMGCSHMALELNYHFQLCGGPPPYAMVPSMAIPRKPWDIQSGGSKTQKEPTLALPSYSKPHQVEQESCWPPPYAIPPDFRPRKPVPSASEQDALLCGATDVAVHGAVADEECLGACALSVPQWSQERQNRELRHQLKLLEAAKEQAQKEIEQQNMRGIIRKPRRHLFDASKGEKSPHADDSKKSHKEPSSPADNKKRAPPASSLCESCSWPKNWDPDLLKSMQALQIGDSQGDEEAGIAGNPESNEGEKKTMEGGEPDINEDEKHA